MSLNSRKILGISITTNSKKEILEYLQKYLKKVTSDKRQATGETKKPLILVTPNPEQVVLAQKNSHFANILNQADVAIPDGVGLALADRILRGDKRQETRDRKLQKISGVDFMQDLVDLAAKGGYKIALIGGRGGVAVQALECLKQTHVHLNGIVIEAPEFSLGGAGDDANDELRITNDELEPKNKEIDPIIHNSRLIGGSPKEATLFIIHHDGTVEDYFVKLVKILKDQDVKFVFVGLGAPKQEYLMNRIQETWDRQQAKRTSDLHDMFLVSCPPLLMSVGGSFDEIAGRVPKAPLWIDRIGFKWLWRLIHEPWRWHRQLALLQFIWLIGKAKLYH